MTDCDFVNDPAAGYAMADLFACDGCHKAKLLLAAYRFRLYCTDCFRDMGAPWPRTPGSVADVHAAETRIRKRMQARGGTDRHMVRNGRT